MGFYRRWIVPRLINLAMRNRSLDPYRQRTIGAASGLVLEIGGGSGQNLPLYGRPSIASMRSIPRWKCSISRGTGLQKRACRCR
jgi:hypothetical protein